MLNMVCCEIIIFVLVCGNGSWDVCLMILFINYLCNLNVFLYLFGGWYLVVVMKDIEVGD